MANPFPAGAAAPCTQCGAQPWQPPALSARLPSLAAVQQSAAAGGARPLASPISANTQRLVLCPAHPRVPRPAACSYATWLEGRKLVSDVERALLSLASTLEGGAARVPRHRALEANGMTLAFAVLRHGPCAWKDGGGAASSFTRPCPSI
jgi:hypothetical protein